MSNWNEEPPEHVGLICRSFPCRCPEGQGHRHPDWIAWQQREREAFNGRAGATE
jgi:hypothetical protein